MRARTQLPAWHVRPSRGWLNDPNGIVHWQGRWHVFFQHNPAAAVHDRIHWGHVSSADLLTWREHPVAFGPQPGGPDRYGCWSGVFVGGLDRPAVAYSGLVDATLASTVCVRYGSADLDTWGDPIVVGRTPEDAGVRVMRDPFVFRYAGRRWALLGAGMTDGRPGVLLYSCDDVENWRFERVWLTHDDPVAREWVTPADVWECPQLVWVDGMPVLVVSLHDRGILLHVVALAGEVTEEHGRPSWRSVEAVGLDDGPHLYAPQLVQDGPNPLLFGWIRQEASADPADLEAVAGCLTFPRRLAWSGGRLRVRLEPAVQALRRDRRTVAGPCSLALPHAAAVTALETTGGQWGTLRGTEEPIDLAGADGAQAWVDGEVAEVFPGGGIPTTVRRPGTEAWRLDLEAGVVAEVAGLGITGAAP
jgi:beta-fructofuranosidase